MEERIAWVLPILHLVAQHLQYGRQDVGVVREALDPLAVLEPSRGVDQEGHLEALFPHSIVVLEPTVLAEALAVVAVEDEDGVLVKPQLLVLLKEVLYKDVLKSEAVEVGV